MVKITREAKKDLKRFKPDTREHLLDKIEQKLSGDRNREDTSYISKPEFGIEFQRLKLKDDKLDHRIYFDYLDSEITVFAVRHRDYAYSKQDLEEIEKRLKNMNQK